MRKYNAIKKCSYINDRYKEYLKSSFKFGNKKLQEEFEKQLNNEELFKGPYVALNLPFQRGKSINELIKEGIVCKSFSKLGNIPMERPLYFHQEEALRKISKGRSVVITTGTGSGKTESFLYPILNDILKDIEKGNNEPGIRALFLYPLNALVNDQLDRVRKILIKYPSIKYGFYTGDTKETEPKNYHQNIREKHSVTIPENELVSREEIRATPPHLLFTNYSMLEYLLIRPGDFAIFEPKMLKNWKYVVLDEAHSYYGAKGIEISLLMRRLTGLASVKPRFILTSATLGQKGKSEDEILDFARKLTSVDFSKEDIIFSKRIHLTRSNKMYRLADEDYIELKNNIHETDKIKKIASKYINIISDNESSILYELFIHDNNVYDIYMMLEKQSKTFQYIKDHLITRLSDDGLIDLIYLINMAEKEGIRLFDLKYHSFIRPLAGAYITLTNPVKLSLTKTNEIDGFKAFELGNCKFCNSPYIIGRVQLDKDDHLFKLYQNKEIDIYENYGNNESVNLDYFLLENSFDEENIDIDALEECEVCSKCGSIISTGNLNAKGCDCDTKYKVKIYKVVRKKNKKTNDFEDYNNIRQCPCCGRIGNKGGVVKSFNIGKDEGTALVSQILLESMDDIEEKKVKNDKFYLIPQTYYSNENVSRKKVKQFLSFSDSRQQASFATVFFNRNHARLLRKRLIWEVIKKNNYEDIPIDKMESYLTTMIKDKNLFENGMNPNKNAWVAILVDLLKIDGVNDGEGVGLYYFDLNLSDIEKNLNEVEVKERLSEYGINKQELLTIMNVVLTIFKTTPALNYVSSLNMEEKKEYLGFKRFDNYVAYQLPKQEKSIRSFLPIKGEENMYVRYVKKACKCNSDKAKKLLDIIFNRLLIETLNTENVTPLVKKHEIKDAYQIDVDRNTYIVKNFKRHKYYRCKKCGRLTPYNVHNVCVQDKCDGELEEIDPDEILDSNYYRKQYMNKKIERIVGKEHTAQINRETAKKYQQDFKDKKINIIFCSTTFEMGIDLGDLETIFMRNVPPTPANYVQRAGRSGRRKDSSAFILTYCGSGSHDYTYFCEPEKMISGIIKPPYFNVMNEKIIIRHLMSCCLRFFFRENPEYFYTIYKMVFEKGKEKFDEYINSHPIDLNEYITLKVIPEKCYEKYHDFKWFDRMGGEDIKMKHFVEDIKSTIMEYKEAMESAKNNDNFKEADYCNNQINNIKKLNMLGCLSKYTVIPKYGFPVDLVELKLYKDGKIINVDSQGRDGLTRDLKIAISEYAPDSEIIVDQQKYTSKYITLPKTGEFAKNYFATCEDCHKVSLFVSKETVKNCKYCGGTLKMDGASYFIEPIFGFKTGYTKESSHVKPKKSYAGEVIYVGGGSINEEKVEFGNILSIETSEDDELLILNKSNFYMCPECGYSEIAKGVMNLPNKKRKHKNYRGYDCPNETLELLKIGHRFKTDVARIVIPKLGIYDENGKHKALSFLYAFLEGVSDALEIERTDINGIFEMNMDTKSYDILVYDDVPGGAGHVKRLLDKKAIKYSLEQALKKVSQNCCDEDTSCYRCLRNYYNQMYHSYLKRRYAKEVIQYLLTSLPSR